MTTVTSQPIMSSTTEGFSAIYPSSPSLVESFTEVSAPEQTTSSSFASPEEFLDTVETYGSAVTASIDLFKSLSIVSLLAHVAHAISIAFSCLTRRPIIPAPNVVDGPPHPNDNTETQASHKSESKHANECEVETV